MGLRFVWSSLLFVILTGGLLGATTLALFTDQAESSGQFTACTLPLRCSTVVNTEGALFGGSAPARITKAGPTEHVLQPGEQHDITITVELPKEAGNAYQNAQGTLTITFFAPQRTNMEWVPLGPKLKADNVAVPATGRVYDLCQVELTGGEVVNLDKARGIWIQVWDPTPKWNWAPIIGDDHYLWSDNDLPSGGYNVYIFMEDGTVYRTLTIPHTRNQTNERRTS